MVFPLPPHPSFASQMPPSPLWGEGLRAATWGRPYGDAGPLPPVGTAALGGPRRAGSSRPTELHHP